MASKLKREFKNVVYNYSDAEAKVREATSNDPWGPSSSLMSELADYTYHVQAYSLVMGMLWRRLNDHGRNWRHVYKSLIVLEYLIKGGSERVTQQCKENMFSIQTLKDFQYIDKDGKDQGANVREKAKQLVALLKDEAKLREERRKAHQTRERSQALGSDSPNIARSRSPVAGKKVTFGSPQTSSPTSENGRRVQPVEQARPGNESEEEMQLKLALQLSKQQADEEDKIRKQEEESLTAALALSAAEHKEEEEEEQSKEDTPPVSTDLLLDLDTSLKDPWGAPTTSSEPLPTYDSLVKPDPFSVGGAPGNPPPVASVDPWGGGGGATTITPPTQPLPTVDPWTPAATSTNPPPPPPPAAEHNPFDLSDLGFPLQNTSGNPQLLPKIEAQFLGTNANLVDLDLLTATPIKLPSTSPSGPSPGNPFGLSSSPSSSSGTAGKPAGNPFDHKTAAPSLIQLAGNSTGGFGAAGPLQPPLVATGTSPVAMGNNMYPSLAPTSQPSANNQAFNPFS